MIDNSFGSACGAAPEEEVWHWGLLGGLGSNMMELGYQSAKSMNCYAEGKQGHVQLQNSSMSRSEMDEGRAMGLIFQAR
jgi:hypothetical protein